ncbi:MAG: hypothetical protein CFE43_12500 [Burkholderiales bacterium PBB3]|nr:MAG: hypothetical protein CFE43_12500 [Burkholderiales bacterium PBB3]
MRARCVWGLALLGLAACSPSLNWRTVPVEQLAALLPCKPDHAERQVDLGGTPRTLAMWGCEAGGALFAVSHLRVQAPATPEQVIAAWQLAALRNLPSATAQALPFKTPAMAGSASAPGVMVRATGKRAEGQAVQAQLAWFSRGADVYHLAVFAPVLTPAMTDSFFNELHWQP